MRGRSAGEMAEDVSRARRRHERGAFGAVADGLRRAYRWLKLWTVRVLVALVLLAVGVAMGIAVFPRLPAETLLYRPFHGEHRDEVQRGGPEHVDLGHLDVAQHEVLVRNGDGDQDRSQKPAGLDGVADLGWAIQRGGLRVDYEQEIPSVGEPPVIVRDALGADNAAHAFVRSQCQLWCMGGHAPRPPGLEHRSGAYCASATRPALPPRLVGQVLGAGP